MTEINKISELRGKYYFLSNFYNCKITYNGLTYTNSEAAFQAQKNINMANLFVNLSALDAKKLGKQVKLDIEYWNKTKDSIMFNVIYEKFIQNHDLAQKLIDTRDAIIEEGNYWNDTYWGICRGKGTNKLGLILMQVRELLKEKLYGQVKK